MNFISVSEAKKYIQEHCSPLPAVHIPLEQAAGLVTALDIPSPIDVPLWPQSSMDGYAISWAGWKEHGGLEVDFVVAAGQESAPSLAPRKAARIFTGAAVPDGADTVVMQEKVHVRDGQLIIEDPNLKAGDNLRPPGSEIRAGETALPADSLLTPAAIGFLAGLGITEVSVYPRPVVQIIVTGNELQIPGKPLKHGQIYESNSFTLTSALALMHFPEITVHHCEDNMEKLTALLGEVLEKSDVVLMTGGVSVGEYDFVVKATQANGVQQVFHKIKQRPGKPIFFGMKAKKPVFGLPGNPASVLTCFYEYVCTAFEQLSKRKYGPAVITAPVSKDYRKAAGLTHFLKGYYDGQTAHILDAQESFRLSSFARSNCLIVIGEQVTGVSKNDPVDIHLFAS